MQEDQETRSQKECLNIVSFKGGGIRGVVSLILMDALEKETGLRAVDLFDVFSGTSTGGIIAVSLCLGAPPSAILENYIEMGRVVFQKKNSYPIFSPKYDQAPLKEVLRSVLSEYAPGVVTVEDAYKKMHKHFVVPYVEVCAKGHGKAWNLSFGSTFDKEGRDVEILDLLLSTSAAPIFFAPYNGRGIDPGLMMNNPSLLATSFVRGFFPSGVDVRLLSVGTGISNLNLDIPDKGGLGVYGWLQPKSVGGILLARLVSDITEQFTLGAAKMFLGQENVHHMDVPLKKFVSLDKFESVPELIKTTKEFIAMDPLWHEYIEWYKSFCLSVAV